MAVDQQNRFELFDPLEAIDFENPADETDYVAYVPPIVEPKDEPEPERPPLPAAERIANAIEGMPGEAGLLLHVIDFCREARTCAEVTDEVAAFRGDRVSIYEPETVCSILEDVGALEMLSDVDPDAEPETYVEDGVEYLKVAEEPAFSYLATAEGLVAVEEHDPMAGFEAVLEEDERALAPLFARVLERCAGEGLPKSEIDAFIDDDPLVQEPRRFSGFFIDKLEEAGALEYAQERWRTTQAGRDLLETGALAAREEA